MPLSITTAPVVERKERPYEDEIGNDGTLTYHKIRQDSERGDRGDRPPAKGAG
jgi:hypothetical protein